MNNIENIIHIIIIQKSFIHQLTLKNESIHNKLNNNPIIYIFKFIFFMYNF